MYAECHCVEKLSAHVSTLNQLKNSALAPHSSNVFLAFWSFSIGPVRIAIVSGCTCACVCVCVCVCLCVCLCVIHVYVNYLMELRFLVNLAVYILQSNHFCIQCLKSVPYLSPHHPHQIHLLLSSHFLNTSHSRLSILHCIKKCFTLKKLAQLGCITQGSLAEITNQMFSLKYQLFWQLPDAFISGSGLQNVHVLNGWGWQWMMWGEKKQVFRVKKNSWGANGAPHTRITC